MQQHTRSAGDQDNIPELVAARRIKRTRPRETSEANLCGNRPDQIYRNLPPNRATFFLLYTREQLS